MGCFSFMCQECGESIKSDSFVGEPVELFLLEKGKVIEHKSGEYDSYGKVFTDDKDDSIEWNKNWNDVCDLMFNTNEGDGIAAIHTKCYNNKIPTIRSEQDPNQGGQDYEDDYEDDEDEYYDDDEDDEYYEYDDVDEE